MKQDFDLGVTLTAVEDAGLFSSLCTIKRPTQTQNETGQASLGNPVAVVGMTNIPCMLAPLVILRPQATDEIKLQGWTEEQSEFHLLLDGYYPGVLQKDVADVDGNVYDVLGDESDSQRIMTRLAVRRRTQ